MVTNQSIQSSQGQYLLLKLMTNKNAFQYDVYCPLQWLSWGCIPGGCLPRGCWSRGCSLPCEQNDRQV